MKQDKRKEEEYFPEVNENGSLLNPDVITYCNACEHEEYKEVKACPNCGSMDVEHIPAS